MRIGSAAIAWLALVAASPIGDTLAAMRRFAATVGEGLWPGYRAAPFGMLLIDDDRETLLCEDRLPPGFVADGRDTATGCARATRARGKLGGKLLAAMPLFGPPSTIVMGTPENTGRELGDWLRTILHEHFHQYQSVLPDYYARTAALDLANGDTTGMWMLNYRFPYDAPKVIAAHAEASRALAAALAARGKRGFAPAVRRYLAARRVFAASVTPADWRYAELQLWQEGVARWTEIALGKRYPDPDVRSAAATLEARTLAELGAPDLEASGREFAYPFGAGEAMLLDACAPRWRAAYPRVLALGPLFERCPGYR